MPVFQGIGAFNGRCRVAYAGTVSKTEAMRKYVPRADDGDVRRIGVFVAGDVVGAWNAVPMANVRAVEWGAIRPLTDGRWIP
jgi:hypothetical protein